MGDKSKGKKDKKVKKPKQGRNSYFPTQHPGGCIAPGVDRDQKGNVNKPSPTSRQGRKCKHPRCKHVLSIYNHDLYCHSCSIQRPSGKN